MQEAQHISTILPAVLQNSELQTQESKNLKTGDEQKFEVALSSKLVKDSSFEEVKDILKKIMVKVGIRANNLPNDIEKLVLWEHIVEYFGGHTLDEIKIAFDMALTGKLGEVEVNCYENFSCYYFSSIMNAYRKWSAETYRQIKKEIPKEQKIFTQDELDNSQRETVEMQYSLFLKGIDLRGLEICKAILEKDGLLKEGESVIIFFKRRLEKGIQHIYVR